MTSSPKFLFRLLSISREPALNNSLLVGVAVSGEALVLEDGRGRHVLDGLVAELEILLERDRVRDPDEDDGARDQEGTGANAPL